MSRRLIDADAIELRCEFGMISDDNILCIPLRDVKKSIANTPTIDVVEVIRCKDCGRKPTCKHTRSLGINGYCSDGERKTT